MGTRSPGCALPRCILVHVARGRGAIRSVAERPGAKPPRVKWLLLSQLHLFRLPSCPFVVAKKSVARANFAINKRCDWCRKAACDSGLPWQCSSLLSRGLFRPPRKRSPRIPLRWPLLRAARLPPLHLRRLRHPLRRLRLPCRSSARRRCPRHPRQRLLLRRQHRCWAPRATGRLPRARRQRSRRDSPQSPATASFLARMAG